MAPTTSPVVRERLLDVLASAAYTYGRNPGKEGFAQTWKRVRPSWKAEEVRIYACFEPSADGTM